MTSPGPKINVRAWLADNNYDMLPLGDAWCCKCPSCNAAYSLHVEANGECYCGGCGVTEDTLFAPKSTAEEKPSRFNPIVADELIANNPELRPVVIEGLLREGEVMNVIAAPKIGKSWLVHALALCAASGTEWLGKAVAQGRALLIDGELHPETLAKRILTSRSTLGVSGSATANLDAWLLRGKRVTLEMIADDLMSIPEGRYKIVVIDALYRFLPLNGEENSNEVMTGIYNTLDAIAGRCRCSVVVVHHASKGGQYEKAVTDVGAGAGAQSRAADTHLVLRQHEEDDVVVVDAVVRSFQPMEPFCIRNNKPGWVLAPNLDPMALRRANHRPEARDDGLPVKELKAVKAWNPQSFAAEILRSDTIDRDEVLARAKAAGIGWGQADSLLRQCLQDGAVVRIKAGRWDTHRFSVASESVF